MAHRSKAPLKRLENASCYLCIHPYSRYCVRRSRCAQYRIHFSLRRFLHYTAPQHRFGRCGLVVAQNKYQPCSSVTKVVLASCLGGHPFFVNSHAVLDDLRIQDEIFRQVLYYNFKCSSNKNQSIYLSFCRSVCFFANYVHVHVSKYTYTIKF